MDSKIVLSGWIECVHIDSPNFGKPSNPPEYGMAFTFGKGLGRPAKSYSVMLSPIGPEKVFVESMHEMNGEFCGFLISSTGVCKVMYIVVESGYDSFE